MVSLMCSVRFLGRSRCTLHIRVTLPPPPAHFYAILHTPIGRWANMNSFPGKLNLAYN